jgi:hypothetical protein
VIELRFSGWFQCRLATDPDPYDEPRGVSGYVHAYVGEPDLDRRIVFQDPAFTRPYGPAIGVTVDEVRVDKVSVAGHPLLGARVDLLDGPTFEGRNGVIAAAGMEPVYPFVLELTKEPFSLVRGISPHNVDYPYPELYAKTIEDAPEEILEATGITDLVAMWTDRAARLRDDLIRLQEPQRTGTTERISFLERQLGAQGSGAAQFFGARMRYAYELESPIALHDPENWLAGEPVDDTAAPWPLHFWFGGWDADVLCGFARGTLGLNVRALLRTPGGRPARVIGRRP